MRSSSRKSAASWGEWPSSSLSRPMATEVEWLTSWSAASSLFPALEEGPEAEEEMGEKVSGLKKHSL